MARGRSLSMLCLLLAGSLGASPEAAPSALPQAAAGVARPIDELPPYLEIAEGELHAFRIDLPSPGFVVVEADQRGVDLRLALVAADGSEIAVADGSGGRWGRELLAALTAAAGPHRLEVRPRDGESGGGRYLLTVRALRERGAGDEARLSLERQVAEALQRREEPRPEAAAEAVAVLRRAVAQLAAGADPRREAEVLYELAVTCMDAGLTEEALGHWRRELELRRSLADPAGEVAALVGQAEALADLRRPEEAADAARRARELAAQVGDANLMAESANVLGFVHRNLRNAPTEAIPLFRSAVDGYLEAGNLRDGAIALANLGTALKEAGELEAGCLAVIEAANTARRSRFSQPGLTILLGDCHRQAGRIGAAMAAFQEARRLAETAADGPTQGFALVHAGSVLAELGELARAQQALEEALPLGLSVDFRISAEVHLGWLAMAQGDPVGGLERFRDVQDRHREHLRTTDRIMLHKGMATALTHLERYGDALAHLEQARALHTAASGNRFGEAEIWRLIGKVRRLGGNRAAAGEALAASLEAAAGSVSQQGATYQEMARLAAAEDRIDDGLVYVRRAIELREEIRSDVATTAMRASYLALWRQDFSLWIDLLLRAAEAGDPDAVERAFEVSERAHARTLQELLLEAEGPSPAAPAALLEEQHALGGRLDELVHRLTVGRPGAAEEARLRDAIRDVEARLGELEWQVRRPSLEHAALEPLPLAEVQELLGHDGALLEYALGEQRSFLFVVRHDSLDVHVLPAAARIADRVAQLRAGHYPLDPTRWRDLIAASNDAYRELLAPAETALLGARQLIVVPDRELFYLPFETLLREVPAQMSDPSQLAPHYVVSHWDVGYAPSATVLGQLGALAGRGPAGGRPATLLAFADSHGKGAEVVADASRSGATGAGSGEPWQPLPGARTEVRAIAELLPAGQVRVYEGEEASARRLLESSPGTARWIHLAVHGHLDAARPTSSALVLADRHLTAREIYDLRLEAELVVLSACQTGLGRQVWGEELVGLSRAFFYSGVPTVVVSLWNVADDSTPSLMVEMYEGLLAGEAPIAALSRAKRQLLAPGSAWQHPYHWAPFIAFGAPTVGDTGNASPPAAAEGSDHSDHPEPGGTP